MRVHIPASRHDIRTASQTSYPACGYFSFLAGTEANTELCSDIPGPACDMDSGNMEASPGEGLIAPHGGLVGGGDLDYVTFGFRSRVAEIKITSPEY